MLSDPFDPVGKSLTLGGSRGPWTPNQSPNHSPRVPDCFAGQHMYARSTIPAVNGPEEIATADEDAITQDQRAVAEQEQVPLVPDQGEDEAEPLGDQSQFSASIASKDWTVETLVSQLRKDRIDLSPRFQRRNAWLDNRKSKLIESIVLGFPIPQIVLAEKRTAPGEYFVLDGKQRLLSLRQFFVDADDDRDKDFEALRLSGLEVLRQLNGAEHKTLDDAESSMTARLENATIRTVVLSDWNSEEMLLSLFLRLNTGSVPLSPQELRQALIPGEFVEWLDETSGQLLSLQALLGNTHPDRRMVDAELMLRHFAFSASPLRYKGNLKQFLDATCEVYNGDWSNLRGEAEKIVSEFDLALRAATSLFGEAACRKWSGAKFERALNRAVFDVQIFSLSKDTIRDAVAKNCGAVLEEFKARCVDDQDFAKAISATTKTADAFVRRHRTWQDILERTCSVQYELPGPLLQTG